MNFRLQEGRKICIKFRRGNLLESGHTIFLYEYEKRPAAKLIQPQYSMQVRARMYLVTSNWSKPNLWNWAASTGRYQTNTNMKRRISSGAANETCKKQRLYVRQITSCGARRQSTAKQYKIQSQNVIYAVTKLPTDLGNKILLVWNQIAAERNGAPLFHCGRSWCSPSWARSILPNSHHISLIYFPPLTHRSPGVASAV
jgi:hypothetical protein